MLEVRREVTPRFAFRLPRASGMDGVMRRRGGVLHRLVHVAGHPVVVRVAQTAPDRVLFGAQAASREYAEEGIARMRFAVGVDDDVEPFHRRFRFDPLLGRAIRADPGRRIRRRPDPWEALAWAITEQLIEVARAGAIQRRMVRALGRTCPRTGLRDAPAPEAVAALAPARLCAWDLAEARALALVRAAREVAAGRVPLAGPDLEVGWRRLRAIRGIGTWTIETLALTGQGRHDVLPAGDLGYMKLVGRVKTGNPRAVASEEEVRAFFAPYEPWAGLAAAYAMRLGPATG